MIAVPILRGSPEHARYLRSKAWKARRLAAIIRAGWACQICGRKVFDARRYQVHHLSYANLGCERPGDLAVYCQRCHRRVSTW